MYISRKIVNTFPCCCYIYLRLFLIIGFYFKIDYGYRYCPKDHLKISNTTRSNILPYNGEKQYPLEVRYYLITGEKTISLNVIIARQPFLLVSWAWMRLSLNTWSSFFRKKKIITLNIKVSLNMKNKSDILILWIRQFPIKQVYSFYFNFIYRQCLFF